MSHTEKMDVLDLIIETLKEHERALDELTRRLEACLGDAPKGKFTGLKAQDIGENLDSWR